MILYNSYQSKSWHRTLFDGVDERMYKTNPSGSVMSDTSGFIFAYFTFTNLTLANGGFMNVGGFGDTTTTTPDQMNLGVRRDDALYGTNNKRFTILWNDGVTPHEVSANTNLSVDTLYFVIAVSSGTSWKIYLNGVDQTLTVRQGSNNGNWIGDLNLPGTKYLCVGNTFRGNAWAPVSMTGYIGGYGISAEVPTQAQATALYNNGQPVDPFLFIDKSQVRAYYTMGDLESGVINPTYDVIGLNNLTAENMENEDIMASNYY